MAVISMTGHADLRASAKGAGWVWEARSVNGRGLDVRLRLPEGFESLDAPVRAAAAAVLARGSVTISLRLTAGVAASVPRLNRGVLAAVLAAVEETAAAASERGVALAPTSAAGILGIRGVLEADEAGPAEDSEILDAVRAGIGPLVAGLDAARRAEGAVLARVLGAQIDRLAALVAQARDTAEARAARTGSLLEARVAALMAGRAPVEADRLAQELAMIAVKADVSEELDRLGAHVDQARGLLGVEGPVGRKFDFLMQEFNREANTLCSKSGSAELTAVGLEMKVLIDQMREQVQNVE